MYVAKQRIIPLPEKIRGSSWVVHRWIGRDRIHMSHPGPQVCSSSQNCVHRWPVGPWGWGRRGARTFLLSAHPQTQWWPRGFEHCGPRLACFWPLLFCFQLNIKKYLLVSTPLWIKHVSDEQILGFVENVMVAVFKAASPLLHPELCGSALQGLSQAMKLPSPTHHLWSLLSEATGKIFDLLPNKIRVRNKNIYAPDNLRLGFFESPFGKAGRYMF